MQPKDLDSVFPQDHAHQVDAYYFLRHLPVFDDRKTDFVDLGAGPGGSFSRVEKVSRNLNWVGVDIEDSGPVRSRKRTDLNFVTYNGVDLPFPSASVDMVFSRQVFEHVRYPEALMKDIARVLRPGGLFVGSVSQLEPFHSHSFFNFTYYGFSVIAADAGLTVRELRPGIDGLTLCSRNFLKFVMKQPVEMFEPWIKSVSPLNGLMDRMFTSADVRAQNKRKVHMAGHLCFCFEKGGESA